MTFWKGFGVGLLGAILVIIVGSIATVGAKDGSGDYLTMLIMFAIFSAFNVGFVYYGAEKSFGKASHFFFLFFTAISFMFGVVSITAMAESLKDTTPLGLVALTRTPLFAAGLTFIIWYLMLGFGVAGNLWITAAVPAGSILVGFIICRLLTNISPVASLVAAIIVGAGSVVAAIVLRVVNGSMVE